MSMEQPLNTNFDTSGNSADDMKLPVVQKGRFGVSTKKAIQITWENVSISAPPKGKKRLTE